MASDEGAGDHVANQLWLAKLPKSDRDMVGHIVLLDQKRGRFGVAGTSSTWRHELELFKWAREEDRLMRYFPQSRKRTKSKIRTWNCEGEAPRPFQLCLEISSGGSKQLFYSREDWVVKPGEVAESIEEIATDTPELDGFLDELDVEL